MRGHLVKCLQNLQFQPFPKVQKRRAIKIIHVAYDLKVWCVCGMPQEYGDMICCGRREKWLHGLCQWICHGNVQFVNNKMI